MTTEEEIQSLKKQIKLQSDMIEIMHQTLMEIVPSYTGRFLRKYQEELKERKSDL